MLMKFKSKLISNPNYQKYGVLYSFLFFIVLVFGTPIFIVPGTEGNTTFLIWYNSIAFSLFGIFAAVYYYRFRIKEIGDLSVCEQNIQISKDGEEQHIPLDVIKEIRIARGTTFHKDDANMMTYYKGNNFIEIMAGSKIIAKTEFVIESIEHNRQFEHLVQFLRSKLRKKLTYTSV